MTNLPSELWELFRTDDLMKERGLTNDEAAKIVAAEIEAGLCPYLPSRSASNTNEVSL